ncbi:hypothetical protein [Anabaena subtropica]|uniref:Glycosyltransferase RgtA/B/C/D-like domain-containing protein n=1 Tax=Anabaena subtropica FACHB-260 TaxID=2692884 RepID=A0ABR8CKF5_9NOST|nr:hypothetical protein [Anabaena subtropica]MBD2343687.1 hypothetical protein [Anabaena subtropica FACHB-260]
MRNNALDSFFSAIAPIVSSKRFAVIFISVFSIGLILYCLTTNPIRQGDGYEYALILQSFFNHFSPDIREADITSLMKIVETQPSSYDVKVLQGTLEALRNGENEIYLGILKSSQGEYFGYHFWLYPLINLPAKAFLAVFGLNELKAFQLTNGILISLTLVYVLLFSRQSPFVRCAIALLYLAGCVFFYLRWPHPEVFIAASILISGCAFIDQRIYVAAIAATLATLQNPSVVFLLASILLFFIVQNFKSHILKEPLEFLKKHIWLALIAALSLFPYVFYYYHYQIPNLIAKRGFVNPSLISWERFTSTVFDLNQGLIVGFPGLMIGVFTILIYRLILVLFKKKQPAFNQNDILLIAFFLMLQPTLAQTNWNHGQEIFSRYAFWSAMALIVWVAANMKDLKGLLKYSLLPFMLILQLFPNELFFNRPWDGHYLKMKSQAAWVLSNFSTWYNPEPEIFAERVREYERFGEAIAPNQIDSPFIYFDTTGNIKKILVYQDFVKQTEERLCGVNGKLISSNPQDSMEKLLANISFNRQGWGYLNGNFRCAIPLSINFGENGNFPNFTRKGWGKPEGNGSLIKSQEAVFILPIDTQKLDNVRLLAKIENLSLDQNAPTDLEIIVNNRPVTQWTLNMSNQITEYEVVIPQKILNSRPLVSVSFRVVGASKKLDQSLQLKVISVKIEPLLF